MKLMKYIAFLLCAVLILGVFAGCTQTVKSPFVSIDPSPSASAASTASAASPSGSQLNEAGAFTSLDPKTVMLTVDGKDITWDELFYFISYSIAQIQQNGGEIKSWVSTYMDEMTYQDYVLSSAVNNILQNAAVEYGADALQVSLTPEDEMSIQSDWDAQVSSSGSEEAWLAMLESAFCTKDVYMHLQEISSLARACFNAKYGEGGSLLADQDIADYTAEDGYLMAKHILFKTIETDETGNSVALSDEDKAVVREKAEAVLSDLKNYEGDDFDAYFDQLMNENSEDVGGLASFPSGYLFQSGDMVPAFEDGTLALEIGQFSQELVESDFGYHIIYRIPVNYDITPMIYSGYGTYTLRYITAISMYQANIDTWLNSLDVTYSDEYKALDFVKMYAVG